MKRLKPKGLRNKGFTLIELIIVIAVMAVLLGIVGTQVIPYLERSREAKDLQIINSYCTAAVTAYSIYAELFTVQEEEDTAFERDFVVQGLYDTSYYLSIAPEEPDATFVTEIIELTGYHDREELAAVMTSKKGKTITDLYITISWTNKTITVQALDGEWTSVFEPIVSHI